MYTGRISFKTIGATLLTTLLAMPAALAAPVRADGGAASTLAVSALMAAGPAPAATVTAAPGPGAVIGINRKGVTAAAGDYTAFPVLNVGTVPPLVMLVMSRDEQLFIKAYTDYTDLDSDGKIDTTYNNNFDYSGYFDANLCYTYASDQFKASAAATDHKCSGNWSGNFLNWVAMSRLDVVRFVLYGGMRSTDTATTTVLERANIPDDLHAWAKVYTGSDISSYAPYTGTTSFCNASKSSDADAEPQMRVATGDWSEWASTSIRQCDWKSAANTPDDVPGSGDTYTVRVQVCDPNTDAFRESFCQRYSDNGTDSYKPVGLLQRYGENGQMRFGLLTGSFSKPRSGGILRRNIGKLAGNGTPDADGSYAGCVTGDEIDLSNGTFCNQGSGDEGIVNTLNRLKLNQWNYNNVWSDCNTYGILNRKTSAGASNNHLNNPGASGSNASNCNAWGNPLSEMYAEALRYIANDGVASSDFTGGTDLAGLPAPAWLDPYGRTTDGVRNPYCAGCSIIVLSTGLNSFDSDEVPGIDVLGTGAAASATKEVGDDEGISGDYLVGRVGLTPKNTPLNTYEDLCTAKEVTDLSLVRGVCPDIPSMEGSYLISGLAFKARTTDLRPNLKTPPTPDNPDGVAKPEGHKNTVTTYTIALAENLPKFRIPVRGGDITMAPLCQANNTGSAKINDDGWRSCYLGAVGIGPKISRVDDRYVYGRPLQDDALAGSFSLVWEDSLWGNDHDNDVVSMLTYCVGPGVGTGKDNTGCERSSGLPVPAPAAGTVCFYEHSNYTGKSWCPSTGVTPHNFPSGDQFRDMISSVKVPSGFTLTLWSGENQTGDSISLTDNTTGLGSFNNRTRSYDISSTTTYAGYDICWHSDSPICTDNNGRPTIAADQVLVRIENLSAYAGNAMLTGYAITGSDDDGVKRLELRPGSTDGSVLTSSREQRSEWYKPKVLEYKLGTDGARQLENPLYYAAKFGGFTDVADSDSTTGNPVIADKPCDPGTTPSCTTSNWDNTNNLDGAPGADGLPDTFFPVRNPAQLAARLSDVFNKILARSGSGTAAAVVANSANGVGLTYQALYQAQVQSKDASQKVAWTGTVRGLWTDSYGYLRSDANDNQQLDDYSTDPVMEFYYDKAASRTMVHVETMPANSDGSPVVVFDPAKATVVNVNADQIDPVWSAQDELSSPDLDATNQRTSFTAGSPTEDGSGRRFIFTWIDKNHDGVVDSGEQVPFVWDSFNDSDYFRYLNTDSSGGAENIVDWIRGAEITNSDGTPSPLWRTRTVDVDGSGNKVMRLGDIVDSTPVVVGTPAEAFDLLYNDPSYGKFRAEYRNRRQVVYVGANDGMLHAFNGGFYNAREQKLQTQPTLADGSLDSTITAQPLGSELWAYVPGNLLPHLRWLADPDYAHMFYVDGNPIAQDVKIFDDDDDHPDGWGTVLIVPFRFGGGPISVPTEGADAGWQNSFSAYVVLDVTNPEKEPTLLAELTNTELTTDTDAQCASTVTVTCASIVDNVIHTYTSSVPAEAMFRNSKDDSPNKFFLFTGSGTTDNGGSGASEGGGAVSNQSLKVRAYDMANLAKTTPDIDPVRVFDFEDVGTSDGGASSFAGDLIASDYNLNGLSEGIYFGSTKGSGSGAFGGSLWKIDFMTGAADTKAEDPDPTNWSPRQLISDFNLPVTAHVTIGVSDAGKPMVFAGSGRAFTKDDLSRTDPQKIVGMLDTSLLKTTDPQAKDLPLQMSDLVDVTDIDVTPEEDGSAVIGADTGIDTFQELVSSFDDPDTLGWYLTLQNHPVAADGTVDTTALVPAERVVSSQALLGGVLLTTTFLPGTDTCTDVGNGRLYGMNYKTGTADPSLSYFGTTTRSGSEVVSRSTELGPGLPAAPSLHVGDGSGKRKLRACVQTSTGAIICHDITTLKDVLSGEVSWREPLNK